MRGEEQPLEHSSTQGGKAETLRLFTRGLQTHLLQKTPESQLRGQRPGWHPAAGLTRCPQGTAARAGHRTCSAGLSPPVSPPGGMRCRQPPPWRPGQRHSPGCSRRPGLTRRHPLPRGKQERRGEAGKEGGRVPARPAQRRSGSGCRRQERVQARIEKSGRKQREREGTGATRGSAPGSPRGTAPPLAYSGAPRSLPPPGVPAGVPARPPGPLLTALRRGAAGGAPAAAAAGACWAGRYL